MIKGQAATVTYTAWDSGTGSIKTLDASNHTVYISKDGGTFAQTTGTPSELGNGVYKVDLTATETNCDLATLAPTSSTSGVVVPPVQIVFHDVSSLASSSAVSALSTVLAKVFALVGKWTVSGNTLTAYDSSGNTIYTGTLTRDTSDQIIAVTETTANTTS